MSSEEPLFECGEYIDPPESLVKSLTREPVRETSSSASTRESSASSLPSRRWRVENVIGTGAFGELYNAFDGERNYAVKFEKPRHDGNSKLHREAELSRMLCQKLNGDGERYTRLKSHDQLLYPVSFIIIINNRAI